MQKQWGLISLHYTGRFKWGGGGGGGGARQQILFFVVDYFSFFKKSDMTDKLLADQHLEYV